MSCFSWSLAKFSQLQSLPSTAYSTSQTMVSSGSSSNPSSSNNWRHISDLDLRLTLDLMQNRLSIHFSSQASDPLEVVPIAASTRDKVKVLVKDASMGFRVTMENQAAIKFQIKFISIHDCMACCEQLKPYIQSNRTSSSDDSQSPALITQPSPVMLMTHASQAPSNSTMASYASQAPSFMSPWNNPASTPQIEQQQQQIYRRAVPESRQSFQQVADRVLASPQNIPIQQPQTQRPVMHSMTPNSAMLNACTDQELEMWISMTLADPTFPDFVRRVERVWSSRVVLQMDLL